ncbi:MAG: bifunctional adenosylcobinamide kinase/adenosylcobinamide-phosphate guanylyltransferase [Enterocloster sp.]
MILVVGGAAQGKRRFAEERLRECSGSADGKPVSGSVGEIAEKILWSDGRTASLEAFARSRFCCNFHLLVRRILSEDSSLGMSGFWKKAEEESFPAIMASWLLEKRPDRILVTDEIGCGIVPLEPFERRYREQTGRICCELAKRAEQVWRISCGLGQRIK